MLGREEPGWGEQNSQHLKEGLGHQGLLGHRVIHPPAENLGRGTHFPGAPFCHLQSGSQKGLAHYL